MSIDAKKYADKVSDKFSEMSGTQSRPYGKALLITGGVVLAIWAARKVPWKKLVDEETLASMKETFGTVTEKLGAIASDYLNGPVADAVSTTKKAAGRIASSVDSAH